MKVFVVVSSLILLTGCTQNAIKQYAATGGSKADGTVKMSYQYAKGYEFGVKPNELKGLEDASARCLAWGYKAAEAFGGIVEQCNSGQYTNICTVTKEYQCLD